MLGLKIKGEEQSTLSSTQSRFSGSLAWGAVFAAIAFVCVVRIRLLQIPLERDEGEYAYFGQLILHGTPPYQQAYSMKLPGIYAVYAFVMAIFGQTIAGIHLGLLVVNAATVVLVFLLAKRLFDPYVAAVAGVSFACLSLSPSVQGMIANAEHFVLLPALGGILLVLRAAESGSTKTLFLSGLLLGSAFVVKQHGAPFILFAALYLLWNRLRMRPVDWRRCAVQAMLFSAGVVIPFGLTCLVLSLAGVFDRFWFWTFEYASKYASAEPLSDGMTRLLVAVYRIVGASPALWGLAAVGLTALIWDRMARSRWVFAAGFLAFSFLAVCPGFYFRLHYFLFLLPAAALLAGIGVSSIKRLLMRTKLPSVSQVVPGLVFIAAVGHFAGFQQRALLFQMTPLEACRKLYNTDLFPEMVEIAEYIKAHTSENDRIAVLGSEPQVYFYADRRSASGYVYMYPLMDRHRYTLRMQRGMMHEIEEARPKYLILVNINASWMVWDRSELLIFDMLRKYYRQNYDKVGVVDFISPKLTLYYWDEAVKDSPGWNHQVYVFKRKTVRGV